MIAPIRRLMLALLAAVLLTAVAACGPDQTECNDGTHSTSTGRGTCSGHGGVKTWGNPR